MSTADLRKRLAKLEARKQRQRIVDEELSIYELARGVAFILRCAVEGRGGPETLYLATEICRMLFKPRVQP